MKENITKGFCILNKFRKKLFFNNIRESKGKINIE
jgi:hypothetical protein